MDVKLNAHEWTVVGWQRDKEQWVYDMWGEELRTFTEMRDSGKIIVATRRVKYGEYELVAKLPSAYAAPARKTVSARV